MYPKQIEEVLMSFQELGEIYLITLETIENRDWMTIEVEVKEGVMDGEPENIKALIRRITDELQSDILVRPSVKLVPLGTIPVPEVGKTKKVIDRRST